MEGRAAGGRAREETELQGQSWLCLAGALDVTGEHCFLSERLSGLFPGLGQSPMPKLLPDEL